MSPIEGKVMKMLRIARMLLALTTVGAMATLAGFVNPVQAATTAKRDVGQPTYAYSQSATTVTDKSVAVSQIKGALQLRWAYPGGWKPAKADKPKCHWVTGGTNSYVNASGKTIWVDWSGKRAYICPSKTSPTGWRKAGGPPSWEDCGNLFAPTGRPHPPVYRGKYRVVKLFTFTAKVSVKSFVSATASAFAECKTPNSYARAQAYGYGWGSASASSSASGRTKVQAITLATDRATGLVSEDSARADARTSAGINLHANAQVMCSGGTPVPPVFPPGVPPPPATPPTTPPPPPLPPPTKDGTKGAGSGTPGQPGGPGAGGQPGPGPGPVCRDRVSGEIRPGDPATDGGCLDQGSGTPVPPPPPPPIQGDMRCIDPSTNQERDKRAGESEDQFGYCV